MKHRALLIAMVTAFFFVGCRQETILLTDIKANVRVTADDGTGSEQKEQPAKPVKPADPAVADAVKGLSNAKGYAGNWNTVTGSADANRAPASRHKASATSTTTVRCQVPPWEKDRTRVTLTVDDHFTAALNSGQATIHIEALLSGGNVHSTLDVVYTLKPSAGAPLAKIDITGARTETILDGVGKSYREKAQQVVLHRGQHYQLYLKLTITSEADEKADVTVDKVDLSLPNSA